MDLRFQSSKWVENIYQRFEALCQEVDDIVNQGTAEYVENHMKTDGENVIKTCIDAVQDLLPSSMVENGKDNSQASSLRHNNTFGTYVNPRIGMTEKCAIVDSSESRKEQVPDLRVLPKSDTSLPQHINVLNLENTDTQTVQKDSLSLSMQRNTNEERYLKKHGDYLHPDNSINENVIEKESFDSKILTAEDFSKTYFLPKSNDIKLVKEIPRVSCASLASNEGISRTEKDETESSNFTDEFHGVSVVSSSLPPSEAILSFAKFSEETRNINPRYDFPSRTSISNEGFRPTPTNEVACDQVKFDCALENRLLQYFHADKQTEESLVDKLPPSLLNIPAEPESTEKLRLSHKGESVKSGAESMMETIDLSDEVKLDESRVIVDSKLLSTATSFWPSSRRSYKKLLKDAFTSRSRLRKEYEQLTIMYGDFDTVTDHRQTNPTVLPKTTTSTDLKKISSDDHEWELL